MDINEKIKNARVQAHLTQEDAADKLGVSRQTMSNWENGKTYPDIVSVVKMSDLYHVSLDHLLKDEPAEGSAPEEQKMNDYIEYLEESTNAVIKRSIILKIIVPCVYLLAWTAALIMFWAGLRVDAFGYGLVVQWIALPLIMFIIAAIMGATDMYGKLKWLFCLLFAIMHQLSQYLTYDVAHMISIGQFELPSDLSYFILALAVSAAGMVLGAIMRYIAIKTTKSNDNK